MRTVVPFDARDPKTRLAPALDADERAAFARAMLRDVLGALGAAGREPTVLATAPVEVDAPVTVDERPLTAAVNAILAGTDGPVAVVMADLALATPAALERLFAPARDAETGSEVQATANAEPEPRADVVLVPGRGGGTNALVAGHPEFRVDYHGASFRDHRRVADEVGASVATVDSFRLSTDVDEPDDLPEVLLHGRGESRRWLREAGFALDVHDGRVGVTR